MQEQGAEHLAGSGCSWELPLGAHAVSDVRLGSCLLLRLERSQIHWEGNAGFIFYVTIIILINLNK